MVYRRPERLEEHLKSVNTLEMFKRSEKAKQPVDSDAAYWSESLNMKECMRSLKQLCSLSPHTERFQELCEDSEATQIFYLHLARIARSVEIMGERAPALYKKIDESLRTLSDEEYSDTRKAYMVVWTAMELDKPARIRDNPFNRLAAKQAAAAEAVALENEKAAAEAGAKKKKAKKGVPAKKKQGKKQLKQSGR
ncbi:MAG: hypothetical protein EP349_10270 [Alphaproteobacteria bacterium]|nr:MAG: hypothetical protein EP349_10270 [Alphaproteobacteria bacterium]